MNPQTGLHRRFFNKRQGVAGSVPSLGGLLPTGGSSGSAQAAASSTTPQNTGNTIIGGITSAVDSATHILSTSASPSTTPSSTPLTASPSSSTGSTNAVPSSTPPSSSSAGATTPTPPSPPTPVSSSGSDIIYSSNDGTSIVYITSTPPVPSVTGAPSPSFLQDPSLEGGVFALVGIVSLIIIFIAITWTIRKRRRNRLERDLAAAVTFDPGATNLYESQEESLEKRRLSGSSSGHNHGYGHGYGMSQLPYTGPQQDYRGPAVGYGQYTPPTVYTGSPNPAHYPGSSPTVPQQAAQGANLTRKFSDRKPVPPLLTDPTHDLTNTHVSMPPQFYQQ